jgi:hypothetical protein
MTKLQTGRTTDSVSSIATSRASTPRGRRTAGALRVIGGLAFVLFALIAGGVLLTPQGSLLVIGPITIFAIPVLGALADFAMPQVGERRNTWLVGGVMIAIIAVGGVALTVLAQAVVGPIDLVGVFSPDPQTAASHFTAFPFVIPLGGLFLILYFGATIVSGIPLLTKHHLRDGVLTFVGCAALALILYQTLVNWGSVPAAARAQLGLRNPGGPIEAFELAGIVISIAIWEILYLFAGGGPFATIRTGWLRIALSNVVVIGLGLATYWLLRDVLQATVPQIAEIAGMVVAGALVVGVLFALPAAGPPGTIGPLTRLFRFGLAAVVAVLTFFALQWVGMALQPTWAAGSLELWITVCGLNLIGGGVVLYCRILQPPPSGPAQ